MTTASTEAQRDVFLGLGSNLGNRWSYLSEAVNALRDADSELLVSPIFETTPVGGPLDQGPYLNCVVRLQLDLAPLEILELAQHCEHVARRVRNERFGPRTLDVDVLLIGDYVSDNPVLTVPHPRMFARPFVLAPLELLDPSRVPQHWRDEHDVDALVRAVGELVRSTETTGTD